MKLNSYDLSREWFNFSFDNPEKTRPIHTAVLFFAIEQCNRLGWKEKFGFPTSLAMDAIGVKKIQTFTKALNELVEFGFIKMIQKSRNQYSANIISLKIGMPKKDEALDKALLGHVVRQGVKQGLSTDTIDKQTNKEQTNKPTIEKTPLFEKWLNYRSEIKKAIKAQSTLDALVDKFNTEPINKIKYVVETSIQNGWTGLFWNKYENTKQHNNGQQTDLDSAINGFING